jgi:HSP20 family protein
VDIFETTEAVVLVAEVAGVNRQEVRVIVDGGTVRIYGHRHPTCCNTGARYHRLEIASGAFVRSFRIGVPFVAEKVSARSEDGLLYITLPKERPGQD